MGNNIASQSNNTTLLTRPVACINRGIQFLISPEYCELGDWLLGYSSYYFEAEPVFVINAELNGVMGVVGAVLEHLLEQRSSGLEKSQELKQPGWLPVIYKVEGGVRFYTSAPPYAMRVIGN